MEDFFYANEVSDGVLLFVIVDGHDGDEAAKITLKMFVEEVTSLYTSSEPKNDEELAAIITEKCLLIDRHLFDRCIDSGSTLTALIIDRVAGEVRYTTVNVGDSMTAVYLNTKLIFKTVEHKPKKERMRIRTAGGFVVQGRVNKVLATSRAFGDITIGKFTPDKKYRADGPIIAVPDVNSFRVIPGEYMVVLASDGLWDVIRPEEIQKVASADQLTCDALRKRTTDNVTTIVVHFSLDEKE